MNSTTTKDMFQLAVEHHQAGQLALAEDLYRQVLRQAPDNADAVYLLGRLAFQLGNHERALDQINQAIRLKDDQPAYYNDLGLVYQTLHRVDDAVAAYRQALALRPDLLETNFNLGNLLSGQSRLSEAAACYTKIIALKPALAEAWNALGGIFGKMGRLDETITHCQRALALRPELVEAHHNLGNAFFDMGRPDLARRCYEEALALRPDHAETHGNQVYTLLFLTESTPQEILAAHRRYAELCETQFIPFWPTHTNTRDPERRLKVGYVSSDFRAHSVAFFMEPVLAHHDKSQVEVYCYYSYPTRDNVSDRLSAHADHWAPCAELSDAELAARILADGIDILVDLAGRTRGNRLLTFARKPAPVQVTYLGYPTTTGLSAMDYRLTTLDVDPAGTEGEYTERLYRLPHTLWCYRPPLDRPEIIGQTPALNTGRVTFGSMNNLAKVSSETIAVWAEILRAIPGSRLVMTNVPEGSAREQLQARFEEHGIAGVRLELHGTLPGDRFRALPGEIDIVLDSFPYNGTTTTCEALWMGLPVVTLKGKTAVARSGYAILKALGLAELAATDPADYLRIAIDLALSPHRLTALRLGMRARFQASVLRDEAGLARDLEQAYRNLWRAWCARP